MKVPNIPGLGTISAGQRSDQLVRVINRTSGEGRVGGSLRCNWATFGCIFFLSPDHNAWFVAQLCSGSRTGQEHSQAWVSGMGLVLTARGSNNQIMESRVELVRRDSRLELVSRDSRVELVSRARGWSY